MGHKKITKQKSQNPTWHGYSYGFKVGVVEQVENGQISANQAARIHGVSSTAIRRWVKKYGNLDEKLLSLKGKSPKQEIAELKKKLRKAEKERNIWRVAVDIIEDEFQIDVKKKYLTEYERTILRDIKKDSTSK